MKLLWKDLLCRPYSLSMDLSPASFQRSLLLRMNQKPSEGGWLRWQVSQFQQEMTEKEYFETATSEADFLKWVQGARPADLWNSCVTADIVATVLLRQAQALSHSVRSTLSTPPRLGGGFVNKDEDATHACIREGQEVSRSCQWIRWAAHESPLLGGTPEAGHDHCPSGLSASRSRL